MDLEAMKAAFLAKGGLVQTAAAGIAYGVDPNEDRAKRGAEREARQYAQAEHAAERHAEMVREVAHVAGRSAAVAALNGRY